MRQIVTCSDALEFERVVLPNHARVLESAVRMAQRGRRANTATVLRWHKDIFPHGGQTRTTTAIIAGSSVETVPPGEVVYRLQICMDSIPPSGTYLALARTHLEFETVHPVEDGNGRIGRVLLNHQSTLYDLGLICLCPSDRSAYLSALEQRDIHALAALFESRKALT